MYFNTKNWDDPSPTSAGVGRKHFLKTPLIIGVLITAIGVALFFLWPTEPQSVADLLQDRRERDKTVWANEVLAQKYEDRFVKLWDDLRGTTDWVSVLSTIPFEELKLHERLDDVEFADMNVVRTNYIGEEIKLDSESWKKLLQSFSTQGYRLVESEWHHSKFQPGEPPRSTISMVMHVLNDETNTRYIIRGDLEIEWAPIAGEELPRPRFVDTKNIRVFQRQGPAPFIQAFQFSIEDKHSFDFPILVYDVDSDGLSDIALPHQNKLLHNKGGWEFEERLLVDHMSPIGAAVFADFNGDGRVDLLCERNYPNLYLADSDGTFSSPPKITKLAEKLEDCRVMTVGDVDGDGDLDVWIGQYKLPYSKGQMPTPYYDANDGFPAVLLINNGKGEFVDGTEAAGLAPKRFRRTYSGSLVDIDVDGDLDLVVASDFAGLDVYLNDGKGKFQDVSDSYVDKRYCFGMGLTFGDYNGDANLDFYLIGMSSTTARRLAQLGLGREDFPKHQEFRGKMGYGNRLYLAQADATGITGFRQAPFNDQVARTGWAWGATSFDFDLDGDRDIYVANGHISGNTSKDYCTRFWCHDIYLGSSKEDLVVGEFIDIINDTERRNEAGDQISWNGFEHNCLLVNQSGQGFLSLGFLMGVALEEDSRNIVSDDFDADGRPDLLVVYQNAGRTGITLRLLQNKLPLQRHWIGVRLREEGNGRSPHGARVTISAGGKRQVAAIVSGDSFMSQHAAMVHFGLGAQSEVEEIDVRWPDGLHSRLKNPKSDRYHTIRWQATDQ